MAIYDPFHTSDNKQLVTADSKDFYVRSAVSSFAINLYQNTAEKTRINKTNFLTSVGTIYGTLRNECSMLNPSIIIAQTSLPSFNYVYVSSFGNRYYFVNNITSMSYDLWRIDLTCDVLMTYKTQIGNVSAFVVRNENEYNGNITDTLTPIAKTYSYAHSTGTAQTGNTWYDVTTVDPYEHNCYLVKLVGESLVPYIMPTNIIHPYNGIYYLWCNATHLSSLISQIRGWEYTDSISNYIVGITMLPYIPDLSQYATTVNKITIRMGTQTTQLTLTQTAGVEDIYVLTQPLRKTINKWEIDFTYNPTDFYKMCSPYATTYLKFNPFGCITLDTALFAKTTGTGTRGVLLKIESDLTGACNVWAKSYGTNTDDYQLIASGNVAIPIQLSYNTDTTAQYILNTTKQIGGIVSGMGGNMGLGGLLGGLFTGATNAVESMHSGLQSVGSAIGNCLIDTAPVVLQVVTVPLPYAASIYGKPLYEIKTLSTLTGFTKCDNFHLENFNTATETELNEIDTLLKTGVIL